MYVPGPIVDLDPENQEQQSYLLKQQLLKFKWTLIKK